MSLDYSIVVPTLGRPCLATMLESLAESKGPPPTRILVVDDRPHGGWPLPVPARLAALTDVLVSGGVGPAAARNFGWRHADTPWVVFLDDDVVVSSEWRELLASDLAAAGPRMAAIQGRIQVPLPEGRRPTDWERGTAGLETARWITADMACRRAALVECGGFDERFPRAFREDADLALRLRADGWLLSKGERMTTHPVRPASPWVSIKVQAGNADDALMRVLHGPRWHEVAEAPVGRRLGHMAIVAAALSAGALGVAGFRRTAQVLGLTAVAGVAEFAVARIVPGPRTLPEIAKMVATSVVIPPAAVWHFVKGTVSAHGSPPWPEPPDLILFDRDGTLIRDVPYNGDPSLVEPMPGAANVLDTLRARGVRTGVVSNQSGVARGKLTIEQVAAVNARVEELLGPFDTWQICPHGPADGCECRKPAPGMVLRAAAELGVAPERCAVIGDIGADVEAARAAGARSVLVPTPETLPEESLGARCANGLAEAVGMLLGEAPSKIWYSDPPVTSDQAPVGQEAVR